MLLIFRHLMQTTPKLSGKWWGTLETLFPGNVFSFGNIYAALSGLVQDKEQAIAGPSVLARSCSDVASPP